MLIQLSKPLYPQSAAVSWSTSLLLFTHCSTLLILVSMFRRVRPTISAIMMFDVTVRKSWKACLPSNLLPPFLAYNVTTTAAATNLIIVINFIIVAEYYYYHDLLL